MIRVNKLLEMLNSYMLVEGEDYEVQGDTISFIDGNYEFKMIADEDCEEYILNIEDLNDEYSCDGIHYEHIENTFEIINKWLFMINCYLTKSEDLFLSMCHI